MPEGDTIYRTASVLRSALVGQPLVAFDAPRVSTLSPTLGSLIEEVGSRGKHLEIAFDDGVILHTHMVMTGGWHLYRKGERWRKSPTKLRVALEVPEWIAVCFSAPIVETYRRQDRRRHASLGSLGPDLCRPDADLTVALQRIARFADADAEIADVLLDQRIASGVGNVFKSEILWACGLDPLAALADVPVPLRMELLATAARLLQANLGNGPRVTSMDSPGGLAVYGRAGKPCLRCRAPIKQGRRGVHARVTFWCPECQLFPEPIVIAHDGEDTY